MLNRNGLKSIKLPSCYLKNTNGEQSHGNFNSFDVSSANYKSGKVASPGAYYMGLFNDNKDLNVDTYSLDGEIIPTSSYASSTYLNNITMDATNIITLTRTITNGTDTDYVINTIGIVYCCNQNILEYSLMSCERIPTVTIKPTETYTFTHKIKIG